MWKQTFQINPYFFYYPNYILPQFNYQNPPFYNLLQKNTRQHQTLEGLSENNQDLQTFTYKSRQKNINSSLRKMKKLSIRQKMKRKRERQDKFERKKQKKDRNLPSNIIKNFFQFILKHPNIQDHIKANIPSGTDINLNEFVLKLKLIISMQKNYIRPAVIQSFCYQETFSAQQSLIFRIILRKFLIFQEPILIISRSKFRKNQKLYYLSACRKLRTYLQSKQ